MRMGKMKKVVILMLSFVLVFQNCLGVLATPTVSVSENTVSENAVPQNDASGDIIVSPSEEVTAESDAEVKLSAESEEITAEGAGSSFATATSMFMTVQEIIR
ncbi:MAG: hypothetical protein E7289_07835 [Lachnospiraceae bacterium]|nr:hypothetical protein [Lachnospiraceae bacterium]